MAAGARAPPVRIVDRAFAERFGPGEDLIGKWIGADDPELNPWYQRAMVVGVVETVRHYTFEGPQRVVVYLPRDEIDRTVIVARTAGETTALAPALTEAIHALDPVFAIGRVRTVRGLVDDAVAPRRLTLFILQAFSGVAMFLAAMGLYGVMAFEVAQATQAIGMRMALGASRSDIRRPVLFRGMLNAAAGLALGLVVALSLGRVVESLLFRTRPNDPWTHVLITLLLLAVSLVAVWIPAVRASRLDPLEAIRWEDGR